MRHQAAHPIPGRAAGGRALRVLFVHYSYPNTFSTVVEALAQRPQIKCFYLFENNYRESVRHGPPRVPCFGFDVEVEPKGTPGHPAARPVDRLMRRGLGVAKALLAMQPRYRFDVIVGSASGGCMLFLRDTTDSAIISYCEHPSYAIQNARPEFPMSFDDYVIDVGYQAMILASLVQSELGLVASEHARSMFPPELQSKVRSQSEGFSVPALPEDIPALRQRLGLPAQGPLVAFFGRSLEAVRGFDIFLEVARKIRDRRPNVHILVIGAEQTRYGNEGRYLGEKSFKRYALERKGIDESSLLWRDFLPYGEFLSHLACIDLAILPTFEGASNWSFFEGMASAVPILSTRCSYIPELIEDGKEGYLFDPYDVDGFTRAALSLLDRPDERRRIGLNARQRILERHTPERAADGYERFIHEAYGLRQARFRRQEKP